MICQKNEIQGPLSTLTMLTTIACCSWLPLLRRGLCKSTCTDLLLKTTEPS